MAVVATRRFRVWNGHVLRDPGRARRLDLICALSWLAMMGFVALLGVYAPTRCALLLKSVTSDLTGVRLYYPANWGWGAARHAHCGAARWKCDGDWWGHAESGVPRGPTVRVEAQPLGVYMSGSWASALRRAPSEEGALKAVVIEKRYAVASPDFRIRRTRLLDRPAYEITGPRAPNCYGTTVVLVDEETLVLFDAVARDRDWFERFERTCRRMQRRLECAEGHGPDGVWWWEAAVGEMRARCGVPDYGGDSWCDRFGGRPMPEHGAL